MVGTIEEAVEKAQDDRAVEEDEGRRGTRRREI